MAYSKAGLAGIPHLYSIDINGWLAVGTIAGCVSEATKLLGLDSEQAEELRVSWSLIVNGRRYRIVRH